MSTLSAAQRAKLPESDFGDPARRLFPIVDQQDVDSAAHLIGKAKNPGAVKAQISAIVKRKGLKLPDAWAKMTASFALDTGGRRVEGEYAVYPNALLWVAGDYADKGYSMTPEENWAAVESFTPVGGNIEHTDFLSGKACQVRSVHLDDADAARLRGEVAVPLWLDEQLAGHERRLSCEWDRSTKTLTGLALTTNPRIPEAALMAAFAGKRHSASDQAKVQTIHDAATALGAACPDADPTDTPGDGVTLPGRPPGVMYSTPAMSGGRKRMNLKEWLTGKAREDGVELDDSVSFGATPPDPRIADLEARIATRDAQFAAERTTARAEKAAAFADAQVAALTVLPAGRDALAALYAAALAQEGPVTFANGEQHSLVETITTVFAALPAHALTAERVLADGQQVLMARTTPNPDAAPTADRKAALLAMTALGRSAQQNGAH